MVLIGGRAITQEREISSASRLNREICKCHDGLLLGGVFELWLRVVATMSNMNLKDVDLYEILGILSTATTEEVSEIPLLSNITR